MCVIIAFPDPRGWKEVESLIQTAIALNGDGSGLAWRVDHGIRWEKGLMHLRAIEAAWESASGCWPRMFHARIATVGGDSAELTHPFPVTHKVGLQLSGCARSVLSHNGHWGHWDSVELGMQAGGLILPSGAWSDSRLLAFLVHRLGKRALDGIPNQKVCVLNRSGLHYFGKPWFTDKDTNAQLSNDQPLNYQGYVDNYLEDGWQGHYGGVGATSHYGRGWTASHRSARKSVTLDKFYGASGKVYYRDAEGNWIQKDAAQYIKDQQEQAKGDLVDDLLSETQRSDLERYGATLPSFSYDPTKDDDGGYCD